MKWWDWKPWSSFFLILSFKLAFLFSSFTLINRLFCSSSLSAIRVVSSAYLRLIFLLAILIPAYNSSTLAFCIMCSEYKLKKQGDNKQPLIFKALKNWLEASKHWWLLLSISFFVGWSGWNPQCQSLEVFPLDLVRFPREDTSNLSSGGWRPVSWCSNSWLFQKLCRVNWAPFFIVAWEFSCLGFTVMPPTCCCHCFFSHFLHPC